MGKILYQKGLIKDKEPKQISLEQVDNTLSALGYPLIGRYLFASNARTSAKRAKEVLGWDPKAPSLWEVLEQDIDDAIESMGDRGKCSKVKDLSANLVSTDSVQHTGGWGSSVIQAGETASFQKGSFASSTSTDFNSRPTGLLSSQSTPLDIVGCLPLHQDVPLEYWSSCQEKFNLAMIKRRCQMKITNSLQLDKPNIEKQNKYQRITCAESLSPSKHVKLLENLEYCKTPGRII